MAVDYTKPIRKGTIIGRRKGFRNGKPEAEYLVHWDNFTREWVFENDLEKYDPNDPRHQAVTT